MDVSNTKNVGKLRKYPEGEVIISEGRPVTDFYKIVSGKAEVYQNYGQKEEYLIGIYSEGRYFGDVAFLTGSDSGYTVVAGTDMMVMCVPADEFSEYVTRNNLNAIDIMKSLARSVETLNLHVEQITSELYKMQEAGKPIPINLKEKISQYKHWI